MKEQTGVQLLIAVENTNVLDGGERDFEGVRVTVLLLTTNSTLSLGCVTRSRYEYMSYIYEIRST
jgi:hypothetical protein